MSRRDYYEILGVNRDSGTQEIKSAYRKLAVQYHPDRNPGDKEAEERFKAAAEAYAVLSDPDQRARYDRFGHEAASSGFPGFDPTIFADFSDILGDFFGLGDLFGGRRGRPRGPARGADLRYDLRLSFEKAAFGAQPTLRIPRLEICAACTGTGSAGGVPPSTCSTCRGHGQVRFSQGFFTVARTCPQCGGAGSMITDPCPECRGAGRVEQERSIEVKIPAGVDTGSRLRLAGEGEHGLRGGPPGDLYVVIHVEDHQTFRREGPDVFSDVVLSYPQAVLGATVDVETLHGPVSLEVPAGTTPGQTFRLRGKGIDRLNRRGQGDHIVQVKLHVPEPGELGEDEIQLIKRLAELGGHETRNGRKVLDRMRDLFASSD